MKKTNENNKEIFRKALIDARLRKAERITEADREEVILSDEHRQKMHFILRSTGRKQKSTVKRLSIALLATATAAVAAIAIFVNRENITHFAQENIIALFRDETSDKEGEGTLTERPQAFEVHMLSYVPEGFEVISSSSSATSASTHWQKPTTQSYIIFKQGMIGDPDFAYDETEGRYEEAELGNVKIVCIYLDDSCSFIWSYKGYSYKIECSNDLPFDEISKMIIAFMRDNY